MKCYSHKKQGPRTHKLCCGCKTILPIDQFYKIGKYHSGRCKPCASAQSKLRYETVPGIKERERARSKAWVNNNRERHNATMRKAWARSFAKDPEKYRAQWRLKAKLRWEMNKEAEALRVKKYRAIGKAKRPERYKAIQRKYSIRKIKSITRGYAANKMKMKVSEVPIELLDAKRELIRLQRAVKTNEQTHHEQNY